MSSAARPQNIPEDPQDAGPDPARQAVQALTGASRTLTVSLLARAAASSRDNPIICDPAAEELATRLGLTYAGLGRSFSAVEIGTAVRTELLDKASTRFARDHPGATIVTLGAGLCTRFARLPDLDVRWADVDLPEVAAIRTALLPAGPGRVIIAASALSDAWHAAAARPGGGPCLFIIEGLSMYLTAANVRHLVTSIADQFPGSDIALEAVGTLMTRHASRRQPRSVSDAGATFIWGVNDLTAVAAWDPRLRLLDTWYYFDYHRDRWTRLIRAMRRIGYLRAQSKIGYFHINPPNKPRRS